ncbi:MAG: biotin/lipoyl-containing protein, partial [Limnobacter sp.]|nr:biotin/lipoyl-containing protein [Limnobacter sp.]
MAIIEVVVPQLSESVAEATLLNWNKKVGDSVARDENLIDIETDKVVLEVPSPQAGVLVEILQDDGATVTAGQLLAKIDTEGASSGKAPAPASEPKSAPAPEPKAA